MKRVVIALCLFAGPLGAETIMATRTIRPQQIVTSADIRIDAVKIEGAHTDPENVIGQEAKVAIYPGRAIMYGSVGEPALVERNQYVELIFEQSGLRIVTEGRALARGAAGERIRVMNESSRTVLYGTVSENGTVLVSN